MKSEANISNQKFYALNGVADVSRTEIESIVDLAKQESNTEVIYRLSKVLRQNPDAETFHMEIAKYPTTGLNGARHTGDYKEALDDCGRLRPGFRFVGGKVVKAAKKTKKQGARSTQKTLKDKILSLKLKYSIGKYDAFPKVKALKGVLLADGHTVLQADEAALYENDQIFTGLNASAKDVESIVNELILDKIKTGADLPAWKQSWASKTSVLAQNFETKKEYTGSNAMILNVLLGSIMPTPYYLTATQIEKLKGRIKKGAKSIPLVYYNFIHNLKDFSTNPEAESELLKKINGYEVKRKGQKSIVLNKSNYAGVSLTEKEIEFLGLQRNEYISKGFLRYYRVFNIADTTGIDYEIPAPKNYSEAERIAKAEAIIKGFKDIPQIKFGNDASYNIKTDVITIPEIGQFDPKEEYYTTLFHEMIHSTLNENRLNRMEKYKGKQQDAQYAFEELIAELGASYLCGVAGILNVVYMNSAAYLKGWHEKLQKLAESNSDFFIYATKEAQKAVDYILQGYVEPTGTGEEKTYSEKDKAAAKAKALKLKLKLKLKTQ